MPYLTRYHIGWNKPTGPTMEEVTQELQKKVLRGDEDDMSDSSRGYWEMVLTGDLNTTWYEHQVDVANIISKKWPETRFSLHGQGDDECDEWTEYFLDGKVHRVEIDKDYPEFNPEHLTRPRLPME